MFDKLIDYIKQRIPEEETIDYYAGFNDALDMVEKFFEEEINIADDFKPPIMVCPICKTEYQDFDGLGILYCNNCGYCIHASSTFDEALNVYICDYCGEVQK